MRAFFLGVLSLLSLYQVVHSVCSKNCVHFEGTDFVRLQRTNAFCKEAPNVGKTYYVFESTTGSKTFLYYDAQDRSWNVASRLGAKTVFALVYDSAEDPTDISFTWQIAPSSAYNGVSLSNRAWEAKDDYDMEVKCGKYDDKVSGDFIGSVVGIFLGSIVATCLIGICLYKIRQRRLLALRRELLARSVREYMFVSILAARRRENIHPATVQADPTPPPAYEDCSRTSPDPPPPYEESTNPSTPNCNSSNSASVAIATSSPDPTNSCTDTARDTACSSVVTTVSGTLATRGESDQTTKYHSNVSEEASGHPGHGGSSPGNPLQPLETQGKSPKDVELRSTDTILAVGVSEDVAAGGPESDEQLLIV